jgi:hypothetical protein
MPRTPNLPPEIVADIVWLAAVGAGHDYETPTVTPAGGVVCAVDMLEVELCGTRLSKVREVVNWLQNEGCYAVAVETDFRHSGQPGAVLVRWRGPVTVDVCAVRFAVKTINGLPLVPVWLSLRCDDKWDCRWQLTYGVVTVVAENYRAARARRLFFRPHIPVEARTRTVMNEIGKTLTNSGTR